MFWVNVGLRLKAPGLYMDLELLNAGSTMSGVMRIILVWSLFWGSLIYGNYHLL